MENEQQSNLGFKITLSFIISVFVISMFVIEYDLRPKTKSSLCDGQGDKGTIKIAECHPK